MGRLTNPILTHIREHLTHAHTHIHTRTQTESPERRTSFDQTRGLALKQHENISWKEKYVLVSYII